MFKTMHTFLNKLPFVNKLLLACIIQLKSLQNSLLASLFSDISIKKYNYVIKKKKRKKENCLLGDQKKVPLLHVVNHFTVALLYLIPFCSAHLSLH